MKLVSGLGPNRFPDKPVVDCVLVAGVAEASKPNDLPVLFASGVQPKENGAAVPVAKLRGSRYLLRQN